MRDDDPSLDSALAALAGIEPPGLEDNDRWAKRVASRVSTFAPTSRRELDPFLAPPFPDDHQDFDAGITDADDHGHVDHAAAAADYGDARGWEGSMSDDELTSRPPTSLAGLSGLTRSGPVSASEPLEGAAKGDDSGLIDLRAMNSQPEPEPVAPVAAAAAPVAAKTADIATLSKTAPDAPSAISASKIAVASTASANVVPPSSTVGTAASASAAAPRAAEKKGGAVIWIALGGLAAAAAAAFFVVGPMAKKDESTASAPAAAQPETKKADDEKVAVTEKPAAPTPPEPQASAAAPVEEPAPTSTAVAAKPGAAPPTGAGGSKTAIAAPDPKAGAATKPTASAAPTAEAPKSAGTGSLDEVLGIGKDQPVKKADPTDNLPDKPDSMDVRSAINSKLSAANACVKGLEGPSNASVTFGPSGAVSGVVVTSGPAKGTGAESCVKNAFSSAKVPPSKKGASGSATLMP